MSATKTKIAWTDKTWNPVRGCSRVSPGCDNCYAIGQAHRFSGAGLAFDGLTTLRRGKRDWSGVARFIPDALEHPLRWRKPARIFVNSMSDLFHHSVKNEEIAAVFAVMAACPEHTFQILTKRADRMREWFDWVGGEERPGAGFPLHVQVIDKHARRFGVAVEILSIEWPLPNVWVGVSAEDQQYADERIPHLLATPAAVRFVSAEPLLGPLDLRSYMHDSTCFADGRFAHGICTCSEPREVGLDWVIPGGEGDGGRPCAIEWIERLVEQCRDAGVACFVKQLGACVVSEYRTASRKDFRAIVGRDPKSGLAPNGEHWAWSMGKKDRYGRDPAEWPSELRVRQFPAVRS